MNENNITPILENYLEAIYNLEEKTSFNNGVRITDIAERLKRSKASVNTAIKSLTKLGHIKHEHYGSIELTESGREIAIDIAERHTILYHFLIQVLGIEDKKANDEACKIEHAMSRDTVKRFREFLCGYCKKKNT